MKFEIQSDPEELALKSFDLVVKLVERLSPFDARLSRLDRLLKSVSGPMRTTHASYEQVGFGVPTDGNIGIRAFFDPDVAAGHSQMATVNVVPTFAEADIVMNATEPGNPTSPVLDSGLLNPMSPYVAGTAAAVTGRVEDVVGYPDASPACDVAERSAELPAISVALTADEPSHLDSMDAYSNREGVVVDDAWYNSPFVLRNSVNKRGLGLCEIREYSKNDGRLYAVKLPTEPPRVFKSLNAACDWTWVRQQGHESVGAWKAATNLGTVPSGGGYKFWGIPRMTRGRGLYVAVSSRSTS